MPGEAGKAAIAFLLRRDPPTQIELLRRYEEAQQTEFNTTPRRLRRVALALHEATRTLGRSPSLREYKRLTRRWHPDS